jgi:hypothetical protein
MNNEVYRKLYGNFNIWEGIRSTNHIDLSGWNGDHPIFSKLSISSDQQIYIDVGVWKGQSTVSLASHIKNNNLNGVVIAVDTFLGSEEHFDDSAMIRLPGGRPNLYDVFLQNIVSLGLTDIVIPLPQTSTTAAKILKNKNINPTLVHIDASHEYADVKKRHTIVLRRIGSKWYNYL